MPRLLSYLIILVIGLIACSQENDASQVVGDYAYSPVSARVKKLVKFYEKLNKSATNPWVKRQSIVSLAQAAAKLHTLADGYKLDGKCAKYVKLISQPNVRSIAAPHELMIERELSNDVHQDEAQLESQLASERQFDALSKLQTIFSSLESEKTNGQSDYEPVVRKDLLDCLVYYIYRHQQAVSGLASYVRDARAKLKSSLVEEGRGDDDDSKSEIEKYLAKIRESMDEIKSIESSEQTDGYRNLDWLNEFTQLQSTLVKLDNDDNVPQLAREFGLQRLDRVRSIERVVDKCHSLKKQLVEMEEMSLRHTNKEVPSGDSIYRSTLNELYNCYITSRDIFDDDLRDFVHKPVRWQIIGGEINSHIGAQIPKLPSSVSPPLSPPLLSDNGEEKEMGREQREGSVEFTTESRLYEKEMVLGNEESSGESSNHFSRDHANPKLSVSGCAEELAELKGHLQTFSRIGGDRITELANKLSSFHANCFTVSSLCEDDEDLCKSSRWPVLSLTRKLIVWCTTQLKDSFSGSTPTLTRQPSELLSSQAHILNVQQTLQPIMKDFGLSGWHGIN